MAGAQTEQLAAHDAPLDIALLPGQLKVIARECGWECMWLVWRHYGGTELTFPHTVESGHTLAQTVGLDNAQKLCAAFAPRTLYIAKGHGAQLAIRNGLRNAAILADRKAGLKQAEIARRYNLSNRQVINILNGHEQQSPDMNGDIFNL
jgi:hypothetical protein